MIVFALPLSHGYTFCIVYIKLCNNISFNWILRVIVRLQAATNLSQPTNQIGDPYIGHNQALVKKSTYLAHL